MKFKIIFLYFFVSFFSIYTNERCYNKKDENAKLILISVPKSGTWMLNKCLSLLTKKNNSVFRFFKEGIVKNYSKIDYDFENAIDYLVPEDDIHFFTPSIEMLNKCLKSTNKNEYLVTHLIYDKNYKDLLNKHNYKIILLIRDPRDQLISRVNYIYNRPKFFSGLQHIDSHDLLMKLIGCDSFQEINNILSSHVQHKYKPKNKFISHINQFYNFFLQWKECKNCLLIRFEDLVGHQGGGDKNVQIDIIKKIAEFVQVDIDGEKIKNITDKLFGGTATFNKGKIGSWKKDFSADHKNAFKKVAGQLLIDLGYEKNFDW